MSTEVTFVQRDFNTLMFPVMAYSSGKDLLKEIPQLSTIDSFASFSHPVLSRDKVIKYVVLAYDKESPIGRQFAGDPIKKKLWAARYAGFAPDSKGLFEDEVDQMLKCGNKLINTMIVDFVRLFGDPRWTTLVAGNEALYQKMDAMISLGKGENEKETAAIEKTKGELFNQIQSMSVILTKTATEILGDTNSYLRRDLFCTIDEEIRNRLKITPERMAGIDA